jgi:hypothetical protein
MLRGENKAAAAQMGLSVRWMGRQCFSSMASRLAAALTGRGFLMLAPDLRGYGVFSVPDDLRGA